MRVQHWEERFAALVAAAFSEPFAWGRFDCVTFAADAVEACTGRDPLAGLRGSWDNWRSAARAVRARGGLREATTELLGPPLEHVRLAKRGDVVLVRAILPALAVVTGAAALAPGPSGLQRIGMGDWLVAWGID